MNVLDFGCVSNVLTGEIFGSSLAGFDCLSGSGY